MDRSSATILIVDDEAVVLDFVDRTLRSAGYKTAVALDGRRALEVASALGDFDLLLTDLMMPHMTGDELARRLREERPTLKVLYLTGYSDQLFERKPTLWADEAFLDKPATIKGLLEAVSLLLFGDLPTSSN